MDKQNSFGDFLLEELTEYTKCLENTIEDIQMELQTDRDNLTFNERTALKKSLNVHKQRHLCLKELLQNSKVKYKKQQKKLEVKINGRKTKSTTKTR